MGKDKRGYASLRREAVKQLMTQGIESPSAIRKALTNQGIVNEVTGKAYSRKTVVRDMATLTPGPSPASRRGEKNTTPSVANATAPPNIGEQGGRSVVKETIGRRRRTYNIRYHDHLMSETVDRTQADYAFYDQLRRGEVVGLQIAGNFAKTIASKTAGWCLGRPPQFKHENKELAQALNNWMAENLADLILYFEDAVALGDFYMAVNSDLSLTPITPDIIEPIVAEDNYKDVVGYEVQERIDHPTDMAKWMLETNVYFEDVRFREVKLAGQREVEPERYPNLIGRLNVIPMRNNQATNDVYGTPEVAPLVKTAKSLLYAYNEVLMAAINGNIRIGRPTPTIEFKDYEQMQAFMADNAEQITRERYDEISGEIDSVVEYFIDFDADQLMTLSGATFKYAQPGEISKDTKELLGLLFLLMVQILEIPEFVMGGELTSSRSTAELQMEVFEQWVGKKRGQIQKWLKELVKVVALFIGASTPGIGAIDVDSIEMVWEPLTDADGKLTLAALQWAYAQGLVDKRTALMLAPMDIEDIEKVLDAVKAEEEEAFQRREEQFAVLNQREEQLALEAGDNTDA